MKLIFPNIQTAIATLNSRFPDFNGALISVNEIGEHCIPVPVPTTYDEQTDTYTPLTTDYPVDLILYSDGSEYAQYVVTPVKEYHKTL